MTIRAIVTDIEGTTSSISFVKDVLFPYAADKLPGFLATHWQHSAVKTQIDALAALTNTPIESPEAANRILQQWIVEDRKATPLKALQGMVWRQGYENGDYQAHVYPDVADVLRRWHQQGIALHVYSSGSIAAQKLFFGYSEAGDLTPLFTGYFDTTTGPKQDADSYRKIAEAIGIPAELTLFLSDIPAELDAARAAGMRTTLLDRDNTLRDQSAHPRVISFSDIAL
ncbi:acireductone synthase [Alcanivorax sp. JB21]|uniref:acireductone synthase n=1 Tax=Alcanivorax limicola TaxID=2874102 RepID=UPI001CBB1EFE|nr:acireductone synthase [Alcanivorax limicola]MBZ2187959.1 acireductone synthase [Alcanivorax limicola]